MLSLRRLGPLLAAFTLLLPSAWLGARTADEQGLAIAADSKRRDTGWGDMQAEMRMTLRNRQGEESVREIRIRSLEVQGDGDKSLTIFDRPPDVKGTAFLSFSHPVGADDQWLYLPALKRVKRIASRNKSGPFMGSEFAYEDLSSFEVEKYTHRYLGDETLDGEACFVVEQTPVDSDSGYTRRVVWLDQAEYRLQKADFYDRKNSLLKTLRVEGYRKYLERYWRADRFEMVNHQTGKSTTLEWSGYRFGTGLTDRDFDRNSLRRAR